MAIGDRRIGSGQRVGLGGLNARSGSSIGFGNRVGDGGLNARSGSSIGFGNRVGDGGLNARTGSSIPFGQRVGAGGLGARSGSSIPFGRRVGDGGLGARSGASIPFGQRVGDGGLNARSGSSIPFGRRVGEGGLGARSGSSIPFGRRVGEGGLGARSGSSIPFGRRVGDGGLNFRSGSSIPFARRVGDGGLGVRSGNSGAISPARRVGDGGLGRGSALSRGGGLPPRNGLRPSSENLPVSLSSGIGSSFGDPEPKDPLGNRKPDVPLLELSPFDENFRQIRCGAPVTGSLNLHVVQKFDPQTGLIKPAEVRQWTAITDGKDWTPENWQLCTPARSYSGLPGSDQIGAWVSPTSPGTESSSVAIDRGPISDGCFVMLDQPDPNGKLISRNVESRGCSNGISDLLDISPSIDGAAVFAKDYTLTF